MATEDAALPALDTWTTATLPVVLHVPVSICNILHSVVAEKGRVSLTWELSEPSQSV